MYGHTFIAIVPVNGPKFQSHASPIDRLTVHSLHQPLTATYALQTSVQHSTLIDSPCTLPYSQQVFLLLCIQVVNVADHCNISSYGPFPRWSCPYLMNCRWLVPAIDLSIWCLWYQQLVRLKVGTTPIRETPPFIIQPTNNQITQLVSEWKSNTA